MMISSKTKGAWRIKATFAGNQPPKIYITPDIRRKNPGWGDEVFNRTIEQLEFFLPTGHRLVLSGMEQYNFFVEAVQALAKGAGGAQIKAFWFCGKLPGKDIVEMWRLGDGKVIRNRKLWGSEWAGTATRGWKAGVPDKPISELRR